MNTIEFSQIDALVSKNADHPLIKQEVEEYFSYLKQQLDNRENEWKLTWSKLSDTEFSKAIFAKSYPYRFRLVAVTNHNLGLTVFSGGRAFAPYHVMTTPYFYACVTDDTSILRHVELKTDTEVIAAIGNSLWESWLASFVELDEAIPVET